jgi:hypothetical protein
MLLASSARCNNMAHVDHASVVCGSRLPAYQHTGFARASISDRQLINPAQRGIADPGLGLTSLAGCPGHVANRCKRSDDDQKAALPLLLSAAHFFQVVAFLLPQYGPLGVTFIAKAGSLYAHILRHAGIMPDWSRDEFYYVLHTTVEEPLRRPPSLIPNGKESPIRRAGYELRYV